MIGIADWVAAYSDGDTDLSETDERLLMVLAQQRVLTTDQLHRLLFAHASDRWCRHVLQRMLAVGLLERIPLRRAGSRRLYAWFISPTGRRMLDTAERPRSYRADAARAANTVSRHLLDGNEVGIAFASHAHRYGHDCGPLDWEHEIPHKIADGPFEGKGSDWLRSDLRVRAQLHDPVGGDVVITRLVEVDRATEAIPVLLDKVRRYTRMLLYTPTAGTRLAHAYGSRRPAWAGNYQRFPKLCLVFSNRSEEALARRIDSLFDVAVADPAIGPHLEELGVYAATLDTVTSTGPYERIWRAPRRDPEDLVDLLGRPA